MSKVTASGSRLPARPSARRGPNLDRDDAAGGEALGESLRGLDFDAEDRDGLGDAPCGDRHAADQPASANRHDDRFDIRQILEDLETDRAGPGDDVGVRVRGDEERGAVRAVLFGADLGLVVIAARLQLRPGLADRVDLGAGRRGGRIDRQAQPGGACRVGQRAAVIAGRRGDERTGFAAFLDQLQHGVERAADLVREGRLQGLELQEHVAARRRREPRRVPERRAYDPAADAPGGRADVGDRRQGWSGPVPSGVEARAQDVGELPRERGARHDLVDPGAARRVDEAGVHVRHEPERPDRRQVGVALHRRHRVDGVGLGAVEIEDHERRPQRAGLIEDFRRRARERQLDAGQLRRGADLGAEEQVVDRGEDHGVDDTQRATVYRITRICQHGDHGSGAGSARLRRLRPASCGSGETANASTESVVECLCLPSLPITRARSAPRPPRVRFVRDHL